MTATCKTLALACAFAARFCKPGHPNPAAHNVHLEFRFGELRVWGGCGRHVGWATLAVPPMAFCDVGASLHHVTTMSLNAGSEPLTVLQAADGTVRIVGIGLLSPVPRPERADWYERMVADESHIPSIVEVSGAAFGNACLGLLTLGSFPSMDNNIRLDKKLNHTRLTNTDRLRDGVIEAGAIVERV